MKQLEGIAWRPHINADIKRMVDTCELCMRNKAARPLGRYPQSQLASVCTSTSSSWRWRLPWVSASSLRPSTVHHAGSPARPCTRGRPNPSVSGSTTAGYSLRGYRNALPSTARVLTDVTAVAHWHHVLKHVRELAANMQVWARGAPTSKELEQPSEPLLRKGDLFLVASDQGKAGPKYMGPYKVIDMKPDLEGFLALLENVADSTEVIWCNRQKLRPCKGRTDVPASGCWMPRYTPLNPKNHLYFPLS
jgi:hypothetical protein